MSSGKATQGPSFGGPRGPMGRGIKPKEKLKDIRGTLKRLLDYIGKNISIIIITFILCVITASIGIVGTRLNGYAIDEYIVKGDMRGLLYICIILLFIHLINVIATYFQNRLMVKISNETSANIRKDLYLNIQKLPLKFFDTHSSGDLMSRLTNDVDNINMTLSQSIIQLLSGVVTIVGMFIAMMLLSPALTFIGLLTIPLTLGITKFIISKIQVFFIRQQKELGELNGYIEERISGQKLTILFGRQEDVQKEFYETNQRLTKSTILAQAFSGMMGPVNNCINNLIYFVITVSGAYMMIAGMDITVGIIFTFILYMRNFTRPLNEILNVFSSIQSALAGAERVFEVMDEPKEEDYEAAKDVANIEGHVQLEDVRFSYVEDKEILKGVSLEAQPGKMIAIVGPTGSGKTTIINLLTKFYDIDSGEILIDGNNIDSIKKRSLRKTISVVLQDTFLFSETVRENIRYGNVSATDEQVIKAAKLANAHRFIKQLPEGYDTILSDDGKNLSRGQRQLLAIARAVLAQSSILILDEATSSIDTHTEEAIQKAMLQLMEGKTTFVIAHRLSTIKNADEIIAVKDGKIIERGNHEELLAKDGFYKELHNSQFKGIAI